MKKILSFTLILAVLPIFTTYTQDSSKASTLTPAQAQEKIQQTSSAVKTLSSGLFNPVTPSDPPKSNPFPLASINATAVDATFGSRGLNVDATTLQHLKNFYFYLEYIVKLELAAKMAAYALQNSIDIYSTLETTGWKGLIDEVKTKAGGWQQLLTSLDKIKAPRFDLIQGSINATTWQEVPTSAFWQNIQVTPEIITQSLFWQKYLKYTITKAFDRDGSLLDSIFNVERRIFPYIPNIEVAYYNSDFGYLRNSSEYFRLNLVLTDKIRNRYIQKTNDWKKFIDTKTKQVDLVSTYSAALEFKQTPFYSLLGIADQKIENLAQQAVARDLPITNTQYAQEPMAQSELTCIAMLKNLQGQLHAFFSKKQLDKTIEILSKKEIKKPTPSILLHKTDDYLYLEDLATVLDRFENIDQDETNPQSKKITLGGSGDEKIIVQDFSSWLSDKWDQVKNEEKNLLSDIKKTGKDIVGTSLDVWQGVIDEAKAIGYGGQALTALLSGDPKDARAILQKATQLQTKVAADLKETLGDAETLLDDTVSVAKDATSAGATLSGIALGAITKDTTLADAFEQSINAGAGLLIDLYAGMEAELLEMNAGLLYLTTDALAIAADITTKSIMDVLSGQWGQLGQDVLGSLETMLTDIATTLWSAITFVGKYFIKALTDAVALVGYITALITQYTVDVTTGILKGYAAIFSSFGWEAAKNALDKASYEIEAHKQTISASVTTVLLIGAVVLSDGAALPLLAMTVGPQLFQVAGSFQQDERNKELLTEQNEFLDNYETFVNNNKVISKNTMQASNAELSLKNEAQVINEERELGFYQNFLSQYFESTKQQMSFYLGSYLAPQLEQNEKNYNLRYADVGALYGFKTGDGDKTGVLNLNPSQGFSLYSKGRDLFSQEIAVFPTIATQDDKQVTRKFWFNQKETMPLAQETTEVEVRWQAIYVLNTFYLGLYFGGQEIDVQSIKDTKIASIDAGHLAKMFVYKKENKDAPTSLGLYENEGKGWFADTISGPTFQVGTWYRMKMQLNDTILKIKVWKEIEEEPPSWQSFTVEKTAQKTLGMISSGASLQYQILTPQIPTTPITAYRDPPIRQTEQKRGFSSQIIMEQELSPSEGSSILGQTDLGPLALQAVGKPQILKGQFIYTTQATKLKDSQNKLIDDYMILGTRGAGTTIINQGASPRDEFSSNGNKAPLRNNQNTAAVSLISGNAIDKDGNKISTCANILNTFLETHGPLTDNLTNKIQTLKGDYLKNAVGPFTFGNISFRATGTPDMAKGQFIYQATSPEAELRDKQDNPIKDDQGNSIYDYLIIISNDNKGGSQYDENTKFIQSLVTGYRYDQTGNKQTMRYRTGSTILDSFGWGNPQLNTAINTAAKFYSEKKQEEEKDRQPLTLKPIQQTGSDDMSTSTGPRKDTISTGTPSENGDPGQNSIKERSKDAGGGGWGW